jgi:hypothetical protein
MFLCEQNHFPLRFEQDGESPVQLSENVFPWLLSSHCDFFHFNKCSYRQVQVHRLLLSLVLSDTNAA